jgi:hypothetical protein
VDKHAKARFAKPFHAGVVLCRGLAGVRICGRVVVGLDAAQKGEARGQEQKYDAFHFVLNLKTAELNLKLAAPSLEVASLQGKQHLDTRQYCRIAGNIADDQLPLDFQPTSIEIPWSEVMCLA